MTIAEPPTFSSDKLSSYLPLILYERTLFTMPVIIF